jgi:hypothetical protein
MKKYEDAMCGHTRFLDVRFVFRIPYLRDRARNKGPERFRSRRHFPPQQGPAGTIPKTPEGIERIRQARTKLGCYSAAAIAERREAREKLRELKAAQKRERQQPRQEFLDLKAAIRLWRLL